MYPEVIILSSDSEDETEVVPAPFAHQLKERGSSDAVAAVYDEVVASVFSILPDAEVNDVMELADEAFGFCSSRSEVVQNICEKMLADADEVLPPPQLAPMLKEATEVISNGIAQNVETRTHIPGSEHNQITKSPILNKLIIADIPEKNSTLHPKHRSGLLEQNTNVGKNEHVMKFELPKKTLERKNGFVIERHPLLQNMTIQLDGLNGATGNEQLSHNNGLLVNGNIKAVPVPKKTNGRKLVAAQKHYRPLSTTGVIPSQVGKLNERNLANETRRNGELATLADVRPASPTALFNMFYETRVNDTVQGHVELVQRPGKPGEDFSCNYFPRKNVLPTSTIVRPVAEETVVKSAIHPTAREIPHLLSAVTTLHNAQTIPAAEVTNVGVNLRKLVDANLVQNQYKADAPNHYFQHKRVEPTSTIVRPAKEAIVTAILPKVGGIPCLAPEVVQEWAITEVTDTVENDRSNSHVQKLKRQFTTTAVPSMIKGEKRRLLNAVDDIVRENNFADAVHPECNGGQDSNAGNLPNENIDDEEYECSCCYNTVPFDYMVQCGEGHLFCCECLTRYTQEAVYGGGKASLMCMSDGCTATFPPSQLHRALPTALYNKYEERVEEEFISLANLEDFMRCPYCNVGAELDKAQQIFHCPNLLCQKRVCRLCKADWVDHEGLNCDEVEKKDETKIRLAFEEKMAQAKIRRCSHCNAKYTKDDGCNKITCRCRMTMCYICRQPKIDYNHFCNQHQEKLRANGKCGKCKLCPLWSKAEEDDDLAIQEFKNTAQAERATQGFTDVKEIGVPTKPAKVKKQQQAKTTNRRKR